MCGDDHERAGEEFPVIAWPAATVGPTPIWLVFRDRVPPFAFAPVEKDLHLLEYCEMLHKILAQVGLISRHDDQVSSRIRRLVRSM